MPMRQRRENRYPAFFFRDARARFSANARASSVFMDACRLILMFDITLFLLFRSR